MKDYKFFCFSGNPDIVLVCSDRFSGNGMCEDFYDSKWVHLPIKRPGHDNATYAIDKPLNFEFMKDLAQKLSLGFQSLRVDFYEINGEVYFGELTFYPASGFAGFEPAMWDLELGKKINLLQIK